MHDKTPAISFAAAQRAINSGAHLAKMDFSFCTAGGTVYTHWLHSTRGKTYRVSKRIAAALISSRPTAGTQAGTHGGNLAAEPA